MTMHKALYPRDEIDRQYVLRKEGGWRFSGIEDSIDIMTQKLHRKAWGKTSYSHQKKY